MARPAVSLIIIAHQNAYTLKKVLQAAELSVQASDELILVLNNPSLAVQKIADNLSQRWKINLEKHAGPQFARNAGAAQARHDYLAFLDDDIVIDPGWIEAMLVPFKSPWIAAGQASIHFANKKTLYWNYMRFVHLQSTVGYYRKYDLFKFMDTAAIMVKRSWFEALDGFNPEFARCEDTEFSKKISFHSGEIFLERTKPVTQLHNPQDNFFQLMRKWYSSGQYLVRLKKDYLEPRHILFEGLRIKIRLFRAIYRRNPVFFVLDLMREIIIETAMTPHLHQLESYPRVFLKSTNRKKRKIKKHRE